MKLPTTEEVNSAVGWLLLDVPECPPQHLATLQRVAEAWRNGVEVKVLASKETASLRIAPDAPVRCPDGEHVALLLLEPSDADA